MKISERRHRISIDEPVESRSPSGSEVITWHHAVDVWASVEPLHGRESLIAEQISSASRTRMNIRWSRQLDRITAKWRVRFNNTYYNIDSIAHLEHNHREVELLCSSGLNKG